MEIFTIFMIQQAQKRKYEQPRNKRKQLNSTMTEEIKIKTKMKAISYSLQWQKLERENPKYNRDLYKWETLSVGI